MIKSPKSSRAIPAAPRAIPPKPSRPATRATTRAAIAHPKSVILFPPSNSGPSHAPSDRDLLNTGSYLAGLRRRRRQHCTLGASDLAIEARPVTSPTRITREAGRVNISRYRPGIQIWIHSAARRRGGAGTGRADGPWPRRLPSLIKPPRNVSKGVPLFYIPIHGQSRASVL